MKEAASALYLYCLAPLVGEEGMAGVAFPDLLGPVRELDLGGVGAMVSAVDRESWSDESRLSSLEWVTPRALHHARVIDQVSRARPVYPARFGTLFTTPEALSAVVQQHAEPLRDFFAMVEGRVEWDVKIFFDPGEAEARWIQEQIRAAAALLDDLPTGRRYLAEQAMRREARKSLAPRLEALCGELASRLSHDEHGLRERPLPPVVDEKRRPLIHWALLWPEALDDELRRRLADAADYCETSGLQLEWTGPWPPYSFRPNLTDDGL